MRHAMMPLTDDENAKLLDLDVWDAPERLTDDDFHIQDGPGWRRAVCPFRDQENDE